MKLFITLIMSLSSFNYFANAAEPKYKCRIICAAYYVLNQNARFHGAYTSGYQTSLEGSNLYDTFFELTSSCNAKNFIETKTREYEKDYPMQGYHVVSIANGPRSIMPTTQEIGQAVYGRNRSKYEASIANSCYER